MRKVYLDNAATTRVSDKALGVMLPFFTEEYGNASSAHKIGFSARTAIQESKERIGVCLGVNAGRIVFTSGATEANNAAIRHYANIGKADRKKHIVVSAIEHPSVLRSCERLMEEGFDVSFVYPMGNGIICPQEVEDLIREDTCMVCVMSANNEIGSMQLVAEISSVCRDKGVPLHIDATQSVGHVYFNANAIGLVGDYSFSFSAHKFHGPKGIGCLVLPNEIDDFLPILIGGRQEMDRRAGTENVAAIVGMAEALEEVNEDYESYIHIRKLREGFFYSLCKRVGGILLNGNIVYSLPHILNVSIEGIKGDAFVSMLSNIYDVFCSTGSACSSGETKPSHVLKALGLSDERALSSVRFSLSRYTTAEEIDYAIDAIVKCIDVLK